MSKYFPITYKADSLSTPSSTPTKKMTEIRQTERVTTDSVNIQTWYVAHLIKKCRHVFIQVRTVTRDLTKIFVGSSYSLSLSIITTSGSAMRSMLSMEWYFSLSRMLTVAGGFSSMAGMVSPPGLGWDWARPALSDGVRFYSVPRYRTEAVTPHWINVGDIL